MFIQYIIISACKQWEIFFKVMFYLFAIILNLEFPSCMHVHLLSPVQLFVTELIFCPMNCSLPGSSVHGIFQNSILVWVAISFPRGSSSSRSRDQTHLSCVPCIAGGFCMWHSGTVVNSFSISQFRSTIFQMPNSHMW